MDKGLIDTLARLAGLEPGEAEKVARELDQILGHFSRLAALDTRGVEPSPYPLPLAGPGRRDEPAPCLERDRVLGNAPAHQGGSFRVPAILEPGGER